MSSLLQVVVGRVPTEDVKKSSNADNIDKVATDSPVEGSSRLSSPGPISTTDESEVIYAKYVIGADGQSFMFHVLLLHYNLG